MTVSFRHKRGDTFRLGFTMTEDGLTVILDNRTLTCQLRDRFGQRIANPTVTKLSDLDPLAVGEFEITVPAADTQRWAVGRLIGDVQVTEDDGTVSSSQAFFIEVVKDYTE